MAADEFREAFGESSIKKPFSSDFVVVHDADSFVADGFLGFENVTDVVEERCENQFLAGVVLGCVPSALLGVLELGDGLAEVLIAAGVSEQGDYFVGDLVRGSLHICQLSKLSS